MTRIVPDQQVGFNSRMENVGFRGGMQAEYQDYTKRSDYLAHDTFNSSNKKADEEDGVIKSTCKAIGNGVKSFVNMTVDAFAKAATEVVVDKTVGKFVPKK